MQNPIQTILRFKMFQDFSKNKFFFHCFTPYTAQVRKVKSAKNHFSVVFYSAKSISDHFTISNFSSFFKKKIFFTVSTPYTAQVRKVKSAKNYFLVFFYSAKSISDHFRNSNFFQNFLKKFKISPVRLTW